MNRCETCEGSGRVTHRFDGRSPMASSPVECPCCLGTGSAKVCELIEQAAEGERALGSLKMRLGQVEAERDALRAEIAALREAAIASERAISRAIFTAKVQQPLITAQKDLNAALAASEKEEK